MSSLRPATAIAPAALPLRRLLALRLAVAALAALLVVALAVAAISQWQHRRLDEDWAGAARVYLDRETQRLDEDWMQHARQLRAQLEFIGILDGGDERAATARSAAFVAGPGGDGGFAQVRVLDGAGRTLASHAAPGVAGELPAGTGTGASSWIISGADARVYRVLHLPLRLGARHDGQLLAWAALDDALLASITFPDAHLALLWPARGQVAESGVPPASAAQGLHLVQAVADWGGERGAPQLRVTRVAPDVLPPTELAALAAAGAAGASLLVWLAVGGWVRRHVARIDRLASAVDDFASGQHRVAELAPRLTNDHPDASAELLRLSDGLVTMMSASEAAAADNAAASRRLADLNATLEQRVQARTRELAVARDEALAAARAKQQIMAGVSHELRTPLAGLLGSLELADVEHLPAEQRRLIEVARRSGMALRSIIDDVLDYSRLEVVGAELQRLPLRTGELASEATALHVALAVNKGLRLDCQCDEAAMRPVLGDPVRLRQVLLNLVGNAVKYTDRGRIDVRVGAAPRHPQCLRFEIRDTGIGIDESAHERLFDPFMQVRPPDGPSRGGTGLGLAIAQRLVVAMGGRIELESVPGVGSRFWFDLELPPADRDTEPAPPAAPGAALHGRVLLVEDNPVNRVIASEMLRRLGLEVEEVENGLLAIEALRRRAVDVVLMDQQMPVLGGTAATARIRRGEAGSRALTVPIVAVTADAHDTDVRDCLAAGMDDHLSKPFTQDELAAKLRHWLPLTSATPGPD